MDYSKALNIPYGQAVCYSGYRDGQRPGDKYPSYEEVKEDLQIIQNKWNYIRLYSCDAHSKTVLKVIEQEKLPIKVMLGAFIEAEVNNTNCSWGGVYTDEQLDINKKRNLEEINRLIAWANQYPHIVFSVSVGNEACVDWTDHLVPVEKVIEYTRLVKQQAQQPVTFCENYVPWMDKLVPLAEELDFISIHTYPVWEYKNIHEGMSYTIENYKSIQEIHPDKLIVITEAGWATQSNGLGIPRENVNQETQKLYFKELERWCANENVLTFVFEAFDESWKGSNDPDEPEKHWGLYTIDRMPKLAMQPAMYK
jgi:exo-beta-1,3-glucanase (GH17 family)